MNNLSLSNPRTAKFALWGGIAFSLIFTVVIWLTGERLAAVSLLPDQGALWYYWKLPNPTFVTRLSVWGLYALHQIALWSLIYYAQTRVKKYATGLHPVNLWALGLNVVFIVLHLIQSQIWYDGLAQDTPVWSSQGSVILMLCAILIMENKRRGMFFGAKASDGFCAKISRLSVCLGHRLHLLVPPDGQSFWSFGRLFLYVPAPVAGQPVPDAHSRQ